MPTIFQPEAEALGPVNMPTFLNHHNGINEELGRGPACLKRWMRETLAKAEALNERRQQADPLITRAANLQAIERAAGNFTTEAAASFKDVQIEMNNSIAEAELRLATKVAVKPTANAVEIRTALRGMTAVERQAALREAFASGDKEVLGAIIGQPKILHGFDAAQIEPLYEKFKQDHAHAEYNALAELKRYSGWGDKGEVFVAQFGVRALKGTDAYASKLQVIKSVSATLDIPYED